MDVSDGEDDGSEEDDEYLAEENSGSLEGSLEVMLGLILEHLWHQLSASFL